MSGGAVEGRASAADPARTVGKILSRVLGLVTKVEQARAVLLDAPHDPGVALHDFRVALRRLRSAMGPLGALSGRKRALELSRKLREVAALTGDLRDEEVLRESLTDLELTPASERALRSWMLGRARRERGARERVLDALRPDASRKDELGSTLAAIRRRVARRGQAPLTELETADDAVRRTLEKIRARAAVVADPEDDETGDAEELHRLRIAIKRLRYTAELVEGVLDPPLVGVDEAASRVQRHLGRVHDLDEAQVRMERAWGLDRVARAEVIARLGRKRARVMAKVRREIPEELARIEQGVTGRRRERPPSVRSQSAEPK